MTNNNNVEQNILILEEAMSEYYKKCGQVLQYMSPILRRGNRRTIRTLLDKKKAAIKLGSPESVAALLIGSQADKMAAICKAKNVNESWKAELTLSIMKLAYLQI